MQLRDKKMYILFSLLGLFIILSIFYGYYSNRPLLISKEQETRNILQSIETVPGAVLISSESNNKYGAGLRAWTKNIWSAEEGYDLVRQHYDQEFAKQGWKFGAEKDLMQGVKPTGEKQVTYTKGEYSVHLYYWIKEEAKNNRYEYRIYLQWETNK